MLRGGEKKPPATFYSCFLTYPCIFCPLEVELRFGRGISPCRLLYLVPFLRKSAQRWVIYRPAHNLFAHARRSCWAPSAKPFSWKLNVQWGCSSSPKLCVPFPMSSQAGCAASTLASFLLCSYWQVRLFRIWLRVRSLWLMFLPLVSEQCERGRKSYLECLQVWQRGENIQTWEGRGKAAGIRTRDGEGCIKYPFFALHLFSGLLFTLWISEMAKGLHVLFFYSLFLSIEQSSTPPQRPKLSG